MLHSLLDWVVGLLQVLFFFVESFEIVGFCHNVLGGVVVLTPEVRDWFFLGIHVSSCFFPHLSSQQLLTVVLCFCFLLSFIDNDPLWPTCWGQSPFLTFSC